MLEDIPDIDKIGDLIALVTDTDFDSALTALESTVATSSAEKNLLAQLRQVCALGRQLKGASAGTLHSLVAIFMAHQLTLNADAEGHS